jgi:hypothetical protein
MQSALTPAQGAMNALRMLFDGKNAEGFRPTLESFYPVDLDALVRLLGWKVNRVDGAGYVGNEVVVDARADFEKNEIMLGVSSAAEPGRVRFTLAHEIGHVMLHGNREPKEMKRVHSVRPSAGPRQPYPRSCETEANRFASSLLMPEKTVHQQFRNLFGCDEIVVGSERARSLLAGRTGRRFGSGSGAQEFAKVLATLSPPGNSRSLVDFFGVSPSAAAIRLIELRKLLE